MHVGDEAHPGNVQVRKGPGVLEGGAGGLASDGGGVVAVGVEGRVQIDEVDALAVHAAQNVQVVTCPQSTASEVRGGHWLQSLDAC